jgi:hypothetical protein
MILVPGNFSKGVPGFFFFETLGICFLPKVVQRPKNTINHGINATGMPCIFLLV